MEWRKQRNKNGQRDTSSARLKEMIQVLKRHDVIRGVSPEKLRMILEDLGPTFVKFGQIMSLRSDMLPKSYCDELVKLRAEVRPVEFSKVIKLVEEEYGVSVHEIFTHIDEKSLGSASIAQVHAATLTSGKEVVIKVQRPGIYETMAQDIVLLKKASKLLQVFGAMDGLINFTAIIDEMWVVAQQEMNFLKEAENCKEFYELNKEIEYVTCPKVYRHLSTSKVLVMEYIEGIQIDSLERLMSHGYDLNEIGMKLAENYTKQVLDDGFFHADPHPGNIWIREGKIVWLDLGMVGRLSNRDKEQLKKVVLAMVENDSYEIIHSLLTIGTPKGNINYTGLYSDIEDMLVKYRHVDLGNLDLGSLINELINLIKDHQIAMPTGITILGRGIITLEGILRTCCPEVNFLKILSTHMSEHLFLQFDLEKELQNRGKSVHKLFKKSIDIPTQISDILRMARKGQAKMNLELTGAEEPLRQINHMVNKMVICLVSAALLIGSSLICTTDMQPKILGIPAIGAIGYLGAIFLGGCLIHDLLKNR
ncbi:ABC1 kinase family protein [Brevibacillus daliensis]|uniref:ABC1 kinase family protein n=1 Tax=Brevibacillus daliensis TaxID=2892995 RepID=UPI001E4F2AE0|nr:AarF/UbiB family protein [Brevibacillus daliensis]